MPWLSGRVTPARLLMGDFAESYVNARVTFSVAFVDYVRRAAISHVGWR